MKSQASPFYKGKKGIAVQPKPYTLTVRDLPTSEKPREKLMLSGPTALSLAELMAIIFNVGTTKEDVLGMANRVIREYGEKSIAAVQNPEEVSKDLNIPIVRACQLVAAREFGRRLFQKNDAGLTVIRTAEDVYEYLRDMRSLPKENLRGLYLNAHHRIIHDEVISIGTMNASLIHPLEVFRPAIAYGAVAVVLAHNHPSNITTPSIDDIRVTKQLIDAGAMLGIEVLDHIIVTRDGYMSIDAEFIEQHKFE